MARIGLIDVDGHNYPNLPLMKISAFHKAQGDTVEWFMPLSGHFDKVYLSKVFSFTPDFNYYIDADEVERGGSGYCIEMENGREVYHAERDKQLPKEIEHIYPDYTIYSRFTHDTAYGFLTRGCPRGCEFCHVKAKEGNRSYKVADLEEFWRGQKNIVLNDPNILACPSHIELLEQLAESGARVDFNQGLDIRLITEKNTEVLQRINIKTIHFAFDRWQDREIIEPRLRQFMTQTGYGRERIFCYILTNFGTTLEQDLYRIELCRELNIQPFVMIYDKEHADNVYKRLQRWCSPFIFWRVKSFNEYGAT